MAFTLTKKKFVFWITIFMVLFTLIVGAFIKIVETIHYFEWYPFIPVFFYLLGMYGIYMFDYCRKYKPQKLLSVYIGLKFLKMVLSMIVLLFYILKIQVHKEDFILVFFLFYIFSTIFQSAFFYMYESNKKRQKIERKQKQ